MTETEEKKDIFLDTCKICQYEETESLPFCNPCKCIGTIKYIHEDCLIEMVKKTKRNSCDLCNYTYRFRDIYKKDTPSRLPLILMIKGCLKLLLRVSSDLIYTTVTILKWAAILLINGIFGSLLLSYILPEYSFSSHGLFVLVSIGLVVTGIGYLHLLLYSVALETFNRERSRRSVRIDSRSVLESMASEAVSRTNGERSRLGYLESVTDTIRSMTNENEDQRVEIDEETFMIPNNNNVLVQGDQSDDKNNNDEILRNTAVINDISVLENENVTSAQRLSEQLEVNISSMEDFDSNDSNVSISRGTGELQGFDEPRSIDEAVGYCNFIRQSLVNIIKFTLPSLILTLLIGLSVNINIHFPNCEITEFLISTHIYSFYTKLVSLIGIFVLALGIVDFLKNWFNSASLRNLYLVAKVYFIMIIYSVFIYLTIGTGVHFAFVKIINGGKNILDLDYSEGLKQFASIFLNISLGHLSSSQLRKLSLKLKEHFRPGLLYFVPNSDDLSPSKQLRQIKSISLFLFFHRTTIVILSVLALYVMDLSLVHYINGGINANFSIKSFSKLIFMQRLVSLVIYSYEFVYYDLVWILSWYIKFYARIFMLENVFYGKEMEIQEKERLRWLPNREKSYPRSKINYKYLKAPTDKEIRRYFSKPNQSSFGIFYIPKFYNFHCIFLLASFLVMFQILCTFFVFLSNLFVSFFSINSNYIENTDDAVFIIGLLCNFSLVFILKTLVNNTRNLKDFLKALVNMAKKAFVWSYVHIIVPLMATVLFIFISAESLDFIFVKPSHILLIAFSVTTIINNIVLSMVFFRPVESYTFAEIIRKIRNMSCLISLVFGLWYGYESISYVVDFSSYRLIFIVAGIFYTVFTCKKIKEVVGESGIYKKLLDDNYLLERRIININEE